MQSDSNYNTKNTYLQVTKAPKTKSSLWKEHDALPETLPDSANSSIPTANSKGYRQVESPWSNFLVPQVGSTQTEDKIYTGRKSIFILSL